MVRALRGATSVKENIESEMIDATCELLKEMALQNDIKEDDMISIIFSVTSDLNAAFPAVAARRLGWNNTALMCTYEIDVPGSLKSCIRVLMHINTEKEKNELKHIYLKEARALRPDIATESI